MRTLYADDLKLYTVLQTDIDCTILQEKLNAIYDWSGNWQLCISYKKCSLMYIGNTPNRPSLMLNDISLAEVYEVWDLGLGVIVDSRLKFDANIHQTVVRAFVRANLIHKCFVSHDTFTLIRPYKVYVGPMVECTSCVWSPYHVSKTKQIESVQRNFPKRLPGYALLKYEARLSRLGLQSLEIRRLILALLLTLTYSLTLTSTRLLYEHL